MNSHFLLYTPLTLRGKGVFGVVLEIYDAVNDKRVAIKRIHIATKELGREIDILTKLNGSKFIVNLLDIFFTVNNEGFTIQNIVLEYCPTNLEIYISSKKKKQNIFL
jgi:glycogen synthase kinase 3 beta